MKAFLLAAGLGRRLRPLTDHTPKCMVPIAGKPLLDIWLDTLHRAGVDEVLVNLHHLPEVVLRHLGARKGPPTVHTVLEPELLGSAGTLYRHRTWVAGDDLFLALNGDNLTDFDLRDLIDFHRSGDAVATLTVFSAEDPTRHGIVEMDPAGLMTGFIEKPSEPTSNLANAGMYAFHPSILDSIDPIPPTDIGLHLLPTLVGRARILRVGGYFCDVGTPTAYKRAMQDWRPAVLR